MISRKIETFLPFVLIAVAVAVALVFALHPPAWVNTYGTCDLD